MAINEKDISALREYIMDIHNFTNVEKHMLVDAITVAILCHQQKERTNSK